MCYSNIRFHKEVNFEHKFQHSRCRLGILPASDLKQLHARISIASTHVEARHKINRAFLWEYKQDVEQCFVFNKSNVVRNLLTFNK